MTTPHQMSRLSVAGLALITSLLLLGCSNNADVSAPAPLVSFKTLKTAQPLKLSELGRPLLVSFWSTTCAVCLIEMPHLADLYKEFKPKGFEMVAVAMPYDRPSDVVELSEAEAWPFLVALDLDSRVSAAFGEVKFTPMAFLIDKNGDVVERYVGAIDLKKFKKTLEKLTDA